MKMIRQNFKDAHKKVLLTTVKNWDKKKQYGHKIVFGLMVADNLFLESYRSMTTWFCWSPKEFNFKISVTVHNPILGFLDITRFFLIILSYWLNVHLSISAK